MDLLSINITFRVTMSRQTYVDRVFIRMREAEMEVTRQQVEEELDLFLANDGHVKSRLIREEFWRDGLMAGTME